MNGDDVMPDVEPCAEVDFVSLSGPLFDVKRLRRCIVRKPQDPAGVGESPGFQGERVGGTHVDTGRKKGWRFSSRCRIPMPQRRIREVVVAVVAVVSRLAVGE